MGRDLRIFVASRAVNQEQMEEICQTTWVTAWERRATWSREAPFDHWLRGIARNLLLQGATGDVCRPPCLPDAGAPCPAGESCTLRSVCCTGTACTAALAHVCCPASGC